MAAGHGCLLAGAGLAFYLFLAEDESPPTRALGRSLVVFNISLLPGALPLALRLRLVQAAASMTAVARPQGLSLIERTARIQTLFVCDNLTFGAEATAFEAAGVRCVLLTGSAEVDGPVVLSENMWPASHRRDRLLRECRCIVTDNAEDIEEALLVASQGRAAVGIQLDGVDAESAVRSAAESPASFAFPPDTIAFGERAGADFYTDAGVTGVRSVMTQGRQAAVSLSLCCRVRFAACWHEGIVIAALYAFARPPRALDLVLIAFVADSLLCSIRTGCQPAEHEAPQGPTWAGALVHGTLMASVALTAHVSPLCEGGGDQSAALALQVIISTALLPAAMGPWSLARWPVHLLLAAAISIAWGVLRISWLDVGLLWLWDVIGHIVIGLVAKRLL